MNVKMYLPNAKFVVGVIVVLVVLTFALKMGASNPYVMKAKGWLGLAV
jgi:hypothetical protein